MYRTADKLHGPVLEVLLLSRTSSPSLGLSDAGRHGNMQIIEEEVDGSLEASPVSATEQTSPQ